MTSQFPRRAASALRRAAASVADFLFRRAVANAQPAPAAIEPLELRRMLSAPKGLYAKWNDQPSGQVHLYWNPDYSINCSLLLDLSVDGGDFQSFTAAWPTDGGAFFDGFSPDHTYDFRGYYADSPDDYADAVITGQNDALQPYVTGLRPGQVTLSWNDVGAADYQVERATDGPSWAAPAYN
jgi:hypothetical protein